METRAAARALSRAMPSTVIEKIDYERDRATMTVTFTTGRVYRYYAVPLSVVEEFRSASSKGRYFNTHIRDRFPFQELDAA